MVCHYFPNISFQCPNPSTTEVCIIFTMLELKIIKKPVSSVQSLSCVRLFVTPWIAARQASLSLTNSRSSLRLTSIESVMPSSHLILCRPLLLLPPIPPSIRIFSNESILHMRYPYFSMYNHLFERFVLQLWDFFSILVQSCFGHSLSYSSE